MTTTEPKVGILAYGSLIDDAGPEIEPHIRSSIPITTPFRVEYGRESKSRDGAPTLIPVSDGGSQVQAVIHVLDASVTVEQAQTWAWRREIGQFGAGEYKPRTNPQPNDVVVESIDGLGGVQTVLYIKIGGNLPVLNAEDLARRAIKSAVGHAGKVDRDGISYLINAIKHGVVTPLTSAYVEEILKKTGATELTAALDTIRGPRIEPKSEQSAAAIAAFCNECVWVRAIRAHFEELFERGSDRHKLLAETAKTFFQDLNLVLQEYVLLQQCKLTDPANSGSDRHNLTSEYILEFAWSTSTRKKLTWENAKLQSFRRKIVDARRKLVAHTDLRARLGSASLGSFTQADEQSFWNALQSFVNIAHDATVGGPFEIEVAMPDGDAASLIHRLADAYDYDDLLKEDQSLLSRRVDKRRFDKI